MKQGNSAIQFVRSIHPRLRTNKEIKYHVLVPIDITNTIANHGHYLLAF